MATETNGPAIAGQAPEPPKDLSAQNNAEAPAEQKQAPPQPKQQQQQPAGETTGEKKPSNAELKKKAKEEKAARRAQAKASQASQPQGGQAGSEGKGGKGKAKPDGVPSQQQQPKGGAPKQVVPVVPKKPKSQIPEFFSHLSMAKRIPYTQADKDVHPSVLLLGQYMSTFELSHATARTEATLLALKQVG